MSIDLPGSDSSDSVQLYSSRICGWAKRNYAALLEKEIEFTLLSANDNDGRKKAEFLDLSPSRKTPVLKHGGVVVWESRIINEYIEDRFSGYSLMPSDPALKALARDWGHYCDDLLIPSISEIVTRGTDGGGFEKLTTGLAMLNKFAFPVKHAGPYWAGSEFTLVDICFLNFFDNLVFVNDAMGGEELELNQRLSDWWEAIDARSSVIRAREIAEDFALTEEKRIISP